MKADAGPSGITLYDLQPAPARFLEDLRVGLAARPRTIPPKYFYDDRGAALFEEITRLDAYYLTRTEQCILNLRGDEIADAIGPRVRLVELGSGGGRKTWELLRHLQEPTSYLPVDIARAQLLEFALRVAEGFPAIEVSPVCADYTSDLRLLEPDPDVERTVAFFPGSTIGNFEPAEAKEFLQRIGRLCGRGGGLLIGADLHKDRLVLERAYDDPKGVTAAFNLNLLHRIRRECGGAVEPEAFQHRAFYDEDRRRIEMRLVCEQETRITLPAPTPDEAPVAFDLAAGNFIRTEFSHKYTLAGFRALAESTGWRSEQVWTDERGWFSVWLLEWTG